MTIAIKVQYLVDKLKIVGTDTQEMEYKVQEALNIALSKAVSKASEIEGCTGITVNMAAMVGQIDISLPTPEKETQDV